MTSKPGARNDLAQSRGNEEVYEGEISGTGPDAMTKPIVDKAEVALEYPDKFYSGTFERSSRFEASFNSNGVALMLERTGAQDVRKSVHIHMHYGLFADVLEQLPATASSIPRDDVSYNHLKRAVSAFGPAIEKR